MKIGRLVWLCLCVAACNGNSVSERSAQPTTQADVQDYIQKYNTQKQSLQQRVIDAWNALQQQPDSLKHLSFAWANQAYQTFLIKEAQNTQVVAWLEQKPPLPFHMREPLAHIRQSGEGRITLTDSLAYYAQMLQWKHRSYSYRFNRQPISIPQTDSLFRILRSNKQRLRLWEATQLPADTLFRYWALHRTQLNQSVTQTFGNDYFAYRAYQLEMSPAEISSFCKKITQQLRPLFQALHLHYKKILAENYNEEIPERIPAHWFPDGVGMHWNFKEAPSELSDIFRETTQVDLLRSIERYYISINLSNGNEAYISELRDPTLQNKTVQYFDQIRPHGIAYNNSMSKTFAATIGSALHTIAQNPDLPPGMQGELPSFLLRGSEYLFAHFPLTYRFWQQEQRLTSLNAPETNLLKMHFAFSELMYCWYVASVVTPVQQQFYTQLFTPQLTTQLYWERMASEMGIVHPLATTTGSPELPGIPPDVLLYPLDHFENMLSILWSYQWIAQYAESSVIEELYLPKGNTHGVALHNLAYKGKRTSQRELIDPLLTLPTGDLFFTRYYQNLLPLLSDTTDNSANTYSVFSE